MFSPALNAGRYKSDGERSQYFWWFLGFLFKPNCTKSLNRTVQIGSVFLLLGWFSLWVFNADSTLGDLCPLTSSLNIHISPKTIKKHHIIYRCNPTAMISPRGPVEGLWLVKKEYELPYRFPYVEALEFLFFFFSIISFLRTLYALGAHCVSEIFIVYSVPCNIARKCVQTNRVISLSMAHEPN